MRSKSRTTHTTTDTTMEGANYTLGKHPGCGACYRICSICKRIEQRCKSDLVTDEEAIHILGCSKSELIQYVRAKKIGINKPNMKWRFYFRDIKAIAQRDVLYSISVPEVRRGIVTALDQMIELRWQEMMELDAELARYSIGSECPRFRYGQVVDLTEPPSGLWYVYHLCHPSGRPFYVGKGIGNRMYQHEKEARKGNQVNPYKTAIIRKLLKRGDQIRYRVVFITPEETEAYEYEIEEIARLGGYKKLTNMTPGGATKEEYNRVFGSFVSREMRNYKQFLYLLDLDPGLTAKNRKSALYYWATDRIFALERLRCAALLPCGAIALGRR